MSSGVKGRPKRTYDSSGRKASARQTQGHIAEVARDLFLEQGYTATSIRDIADRAGVAVQTIYNAFDGKPAIVSRIVDMAVVGDDEPVALQERDEARRVQAATDPREVLEGWSRMATGIFVRLLPLLPLLREAIGTDPSLASLWRQNAIDNRYSDTRAVALQLKKLKALPRGVTVDRAADVMWAYASFDTAEALIVERGWTPEAYAAWTARAFGAFFEIEAG
jgi:AcrR family transcriptional regulator